MVRLLPFLNLFSGSLQQNSAFKQDEDCSHGSDECSLKTTMTKQEVYAD
jgi:hypothetical protein